MLTPAISMLVSESLLSLYPIFVKKIGLTLVHQVWARLVAYVGISAIFVNWSFIGSSLFTADAVILAAINLSHIFFSYEGFRNLDSGVSFAIFNTYPLMILLIAGVMWNNVYLLVLLGLALFVLSESKGSEGTKERSTTDKEQNSLKEKTKEGSKEKTDSTYGIAMVLLAALTEALIYFMVRRIKTNNHWNHVFLSYFVGFVAFSAYLLVKGTDLSLSGTTLPRLGLAVGLNGFIGAGAYFLRFFAASNLTASIFAPLAYFGMVMSYVYGIVFNQETLSWEKVGGTLCILAANYLSPKT
jgi:drug/metabolite transporter (DMT)-like permease